MATVEPGMLTSWYQDYMKSNPDAAQASTSTANTTAWAPDKNSTVQGQLSNVLDAGGPLMDRATTRAAQQVNARGLLNSSIGVGAGQSALYDAAMPIATNDANTFAAAGKRNADSADQTSQFNANAANANAQFNASADNTAIGQQRAAGIQSEQTAQQRAEAATGREFTTSERIGAQGFQAGESELGRKQQTMLQSTDIANQQTMQAAGFGQQTALQDRDFAQQNKTQAADLASRYDLANMDVASREKLQAADIANQQKLQEANATLQTGLQATDNAVKQSMQVYDAALKQSMQGLDNESRLQIATLDADNRMAMAQLEAKYKNELQASQSMAASYQSMVDSFTRVMLSPDLSGDVDPKTGLSPKQTALNNITQLYENTLRMQSDVSGLNLGTLMSGDLPDGQAGPPAPSPATAGLTPVPQPAPAPAPYEDYGNPGGA